MSLLIKESKSHLQETLHRESYLTDNTLDKTRPKKKEENNMEMHDKIIS